VCAPTTHTTMLPTQTRSHRTSIPATGLGSILVAAPQLALAGDRAVVVELAVAVGLGESETTATRVGAATTTTTGAIR
jgi:hypothetical protein